LLQLQQLRSRAAPGSVRAAGGFSASISRLSLGAEPGSMRFSRWIVGALRPGTIAARHRRSMRSPGQGCAASAPGRWAPGVFIGRSQPQPAMAGFERAQRLLWNRFLEACGRMAIAFPHRLKSRCRTAGDPRNFSKAKRGILVTTNSRSWAQSRPRGWRRDVVRISVEGVPTPGGRRSWRSGSQWPFEGHRRRGAPHPRVHLDHPTTSPLAGLIRELELRPRFSNADLAA